MNRSSARRPWHQHFETVGSITAIVVGVAALFVSFDQSRVMREEIRASIWPALQVDGFASLENGTLAIGLSVQNAGVGPALVERVTIRHDDSPVEDLDALRALMPPGADLSRTSLTGRVVAAGASVRPFELRYPAEESDDAIDVLNRLLSRWSAEVCYCSTLGQCWVASDDPGAPTMVDSCEGQPGGDF
ncbi:hypothetical protein [Wenzhouxiangella sediminis]|uniref:Uncharacterized protein n=1 Tax=Wenzhouxiangella sediminis TaxID=1792836 RepID=A0A3E1K993_9GAMM|nr:hypothetical protein [Wenzhouxiangella sediminis]RFF30704.1 hypothetical protein DZC52_07170 [Wenzhouxiangella sediminis]